MATKSSSRAIRCALYVLKHFTFQHAGLPGKFTRKFVEIYNKGDVPVSLYPARHIMMTSLPNGDTIRLYLPIFTNVPSAAQTNAWHASSMAGHEIALLHVGRKRFSMREDSALLRLGQQYGVQAPADLNSIRFREMVRYFNAVQAAVYAPVGMDLFFPNTASDALAGWGEDTDADYDFFFMVSLFAQQYGGAVTFETYKVLFEQHLAHERENAAVPRNTFRISFDVTERSRAMALLFNRLGTTDTAEMRALMQMPLSLLRELYPTHENDPRHGTVSGWQMLV